MCRRGTAQGIGTVVFLGRGQALSAGATDPVEGGLSLQETLKQLLAQRAEQASDPTFLVRLADVYLDLGDDPTREQSARKAFHEEGAKAAQAAIELQERNADAHYLYAANLGSSAQLTGLMASGVTGQEVKRHNDRAKALDRKYVG